MVLSRTPTPHPLLMAKLKKAATQDERERGEALARVYDSAKSDDASSNDSCCSTPREEDGPTQAPSLHFSPSDEDSGPGTPLPAKHPAARAAVRAALNRAPGSPNPNPNAHVTWWDQAGGAAPDAATLAAMARDVAAALRRLAAAAAATAAETGAAGGFAVGQRRFGELAAAQADALAEFAAGLAPMRAANAE